MKLFLFIIFFSSYLYSQQVEISATAYSIVSGYTQFYQIQDRNAFKNSNPSEIEYSRKWHKLQTLESISLINLGLQIGLINQSNIPKIITDVLEVGAIRWIVRDGVYQTLLTNSFFNQSKETTAQFEKFGTSYVKFSLLFAILIFKYFILPEL